MGFLVTADESTAEALVSWLVMASGLVIVAAGVVTALKGRWGWLLIGCLLAGAPWLASAWFAAEPGSVWARRRLGVRAE